MKNKHKQKITYQSGSASHNQFRQSVSIEIKHRQTGHRTRPSHAPLACNRRGTGCRGEPFALQQRCRARCHADRTPSSGREGRGGGPPGLYGGVLGRIEGGLVGKAQGLRRGRRGLSGCLEAVLCWEERVRGQLLDRPVGVDADGAVLEATGEDSRSDVEEGGDAVGLGKGEEHLLLDAVLIRRGRRGGEGGIVDLI